MTNETAMQVVQAIQFVLAETNQLEFGRVTADHADFVPRGAKQGRSVRVEIRRYGNMPNFDIIPVVHGLPSYESKVRRMTESIVTFPYLLSSVFSWARTGNERVNENRRRRTSRRPRRTSRRRR